jgi:peptidoglycan hydrolase-like protein with peptidoglycan-binding domain
VCAVIIFAIGSMAIAIATTPVLSTRSYAAEAVSGTGEVEATRSLVREIQFMLERLGMDPGPIDGVVGVQTLGAYHKFEERFGLPVTELANGGRIPASVLARLRSEASRVIFEGERTPEGAAAAAKPPPAPAQPAAEKADRFAACKFNPDDFRIGSTQYTPEKYLEAGFEGSTARAVSMLRDRLDEARQIAGNVGGAALTEVQRQARVLDYFDCRLKIEQASEK